MRKKLLALVCAAVLTFGTSMTVFAASPSTGTVEQPDPDQKANTGIEQLPDTPEGCAAKTALSAGFTGTAISNTTLESSLVAANNIVLNHLADVGNALGRPELVNAASDPNGVVTAQFVTYLNITPSSAVRDADGFYHIGIGVAGIQPGDIIVGLHYDETAKAWEGLIPTGISNNTVGFRTRNCSPFVVIKLTVQQASQEIPAPSTGETLPYTAFAVIAVGVAGAVFFGRKYLQQKQK